MSVFNHESFTSPQKHIPFDITQRFKRWAEVKDIPLVLDILKRGRELEEHLKYFRSWNDLVADRPETVFKLMQSGLAVANYVDKPNADPTDIASHSEYLKQMEAQYGFCYIHATGTLARYLFTPQLNITQTWKFSWHPQFPDGAWQHETTLEIPESEKGAKDFWIIDEKYVYNPSNNTQPVANELMLRTPSGVFNLHESALEHIPEFSFESFSAKTGMVNLSIQDGITLAEHYFPFLTNPPGEY